MLPSISFRTIFHVHCVLKHLSHTTKVVKLWLGTQRNKPVEFKTLLKAKKTPIYLQKICLIILYVMQKRT